mgnify:CR=1 FL=1
MKKAIYGIIGGLSTVIALEAFIRLVISIYLKLDIIFLGYSAYPGMFWPIFLVLITAFTSFFGGMLAGTVGRNHLYVVLSIYVLILFIIRVAQLQYIINTEAGFNSSFYASVALIVSILGAVGSWLLLKRNRTGSQENSVQTPGKSENETGSRSSNE